MPDQIISGSVIQRTFVGRDLPVALFAASVPLNEVATGSLLEGDNAGFKTLVAELVSLPAGALLDESQYGALVTKVVERDWPHRWWRYMPHPAWEELVFSWDRRQQDLLQEMRSAEKPIRAFAEHSIALMVSHGQALTPYWFAFQPTAEDLGRELKLDTDETAFTTGMACLSARLQRSERTSDFTKAVLQYDLPFGSSPRVSSDSLLKLLDSGKKMCLGPLVAGGTLGIGQLSQGLYVAAILT